MGARASSVQLREREVAPSWLEGAHASRLMHRESRVPVRAAPLARYRRVFPERYVIWNWFHQLYEIRQQNAATGRDERVTFVCRWVAHPVHGKLVSTYRAFDHEYVTERLEDWALLQRHGFATHSAMQDTKNLENARRKAAAADREWDDIWKDLRLWLPAIAAEHRGERLDVARTFRRPQVRGGLTL